jgi:hypothetical protein
MSARTAFPLEAWERTSVDPFSTIASGSVEPWAAA